MKQKQQSEIKIIGEDRVQPHDINTEHVVLATLMRYNEKYMEYSEKLNEDLFFYPYEKNIFKSIAGVIGGDGITDINSLCMYGKVHSLVFAVLDAYKEQTEQINRQALLSLFPLASPTTFEQDIKRLSYLARQRKGWRLLQIAANNILDPTLNIEEEVSKCIEGLSELHNDESDVISTIGDAIEELTGIVNDNTEGRKISLTTGFKIFDEHFLLRPSTMTVIAAFSGVGKSALAMNITKAIAAQGEPCAYYSLEMGKSELAARVISRDAFMPSSIIMNKKLNAWQMRDFEVAVGKNKALPIYIDERSTVNFDATCASIRTMKKKYGIKLAVIDYLQIYSQTSDNDESSLGYMARMAKNIAKECEIAVILLSQLNRSGSHPNIMMLRGSGQISESADNVVLIDRPEAYKDGKVISYDGDFSDQPINGTALLMLQKVRGDSTDSRIVGFKGEYTQFYELDDDMSFEKPVPQDQQIFLSEDSSATPF